MNDEQHFLANAYLDGELTDDERRIAEADTAVMAEVDSLRDLRNRMADVPAPQPAARDAAIGAAMAEFTRGQVDATASAGGSPLRSSTRRPLSSRYLAIAAAVVAIGLLGVIVASVGRRGADDNADSATQMEAPDATLTADADSAVDPNDAGRAEMAVSDEMMAGQATEVSGDIADEMADAAEQMSQEMSQEMLSDMSSGAASPMTAETAADIDPAYDTAQFGDRRPDIDVEGPITNDLELGAFGTQLLEEQIAGRLAPTPNSQCPPELNILDERRIVLDGVDTDVYIAVQEIEQQVVAVDTLTCAPLVDGPLFTPSGP